MINVHVDDGLHVPTILAARCFAVLAAAYSRQMKEVSVMRVTMYKKVLQRWWGEVRQGGTASHCEGLQGWGVGVQP